jgi:hypothetical protein
MEIAVCFLLCFGVFLYAAIRISGLKNDLSILRKQVEKIEKNGASQKIENFAAQTTNASELSPFPIADVKTAPEPAPSYRPAALITESSIEESSRPARGGFPAASEDFVSASEVAPEPQKIPKTYRPPEPPKNAPEKKTPTEKSYESFIGGRLFAVLAAVLIFIGMIFLAVTAFTRFGSAGKIAIMFTASAVVAAAGAILILRAKNAFSTAVLGCGLGTILISVMATHFYFDYLEPLSLIALLIVWGAAVLFLSKKFDSFALTLLSHAGLTICFIICAFGGIGLELMYVWQFILFECAASALMIIGGIFVSRKHTLSGLSAAAVMLFFTVIALASSADTPHYDYFDDVLYSWTPDDVTAVFSLGVQFFLVIAVSVAACFTLEKQKADKTVSTLIQSLFGLVFTVTTFVIIEVLSEYIRSLSGAWYAFIFISAIVAVLAVSALFPVLRMRKQGENGYYTAAAWFTLSTLFITIIIHQNSYPQSATFDASLFIPFAFLMLLLFKIRPFRPLIIFSVAGIVFDFFYMMFDGFSDLSVIGKFTLPFTAGYALLYVLYAFALYKTCPKTKRERTTAIPIRIISLIGLELCIIEIIGLEFRNDDEFVSAVMLCIIGTIIWCVYANLKSQSKAQTVMLLINEGVLLTASFAAALGEIGYGKGLVILFFAAVYALFRVSLIFTGESSAPETVYSAAKCTALLLVAASVFGVNAPYIFSIIIILSGLLYTVGGFVLKNKTLRSAGLAVSIIAVFKMTIVDVWETENLVRVIALITGGIICFVISAIYNKTAKKLSDINPLSEITHKADTQTIPAEPENNLAEEKSNEDTN